MSAPASYSRGFSTLGCPDFDLDAVVALAAAFGLHAVELRALRGSFQVPDILAEAFGTPAAAAEWLRRQPVSVAALNTSLVLAGSGESDRAEFLRFVPWAEAMGVRYLRVFDGRVAAGAATEPIVTGLDWWRQRRHAEGWKTDMMIETHDSLLTSASIQALVHAVPDAAILWDSHHTWRRGGEEPVQTWSQIRSNVVHIHVKDSVKSDRPEGYHYVPPGVGEFPMQALRAVLQQEYAGTLSLEWEKPWAPYLGSLKSALESAAANRWW